MKKLLCIFLMTALVSCAGDSQNIVYKPAPQILPQHIKSLSVEPFSNKSSIFGIEQRLTLKIIDEFLKDGQYKIVNPNEADGMLSGEIKNYLMTPIQYDSNMVPTVYKITVQYAIKLTDKKTNTILWEEKTLVANQIYSASTLPGGMTEEEAREKIWDIISKDVVKRTVKGFGSVTGVSEKKI
ncbi:MAG: LptE family protein [Elusimicrobia bacterium]|jgi:hypothetical protein|nr:LptE family protein [Elusimicrobiota bacterium]